MSMLEPAPVAMDADDADELCEEYLCAICQQLVLDPHTVLICPYMSALYALYVCLILCAICQQLVLDPHTVCPLSALCVCLICLTCLP